MSENPQDGVSAISLTSIQNNVGGYLMAARFEEITNLRTPWVVTPKQLQEEFLDRLREKIETAVSMVVTAIASQGITGIPVVIEKMAIKDEAKAVVIMAKGTEGMHAVAERIGSKALIIFADPEEFFGNLDAIKAQADQRDLNLED